MNGLENANTAPSETSPATQSPFEQARDLYLAIPESTNEQRGTKRHICPDGSQVWAIDKYVGLPNPHINSGIHFMFRVHGPTEGSLKGSEVTFELDREGYGSMVFPDFPVMLNGKQVTILPNPYKHQVDSEVQLALVDWATRIVQNNAYSPLGLTVPTR